jgi:tetraacyldisaccharide 4'-kinase
MDAPDKIIITTEKDAVRLQKYGDELRNLPFFVLPIAVSFLFSDARRFNDLIVHFIRNFAWAEANRSSVSKQPPA